MQFIAGDVPKNADFHPSEKEGWKTMDSPNFLTAYGLGVIGPYVLGGGLFIIVHYLVTWLTGQALFEFESFWPAMFVYFISLPLIRELVRSLAYWGRWIEVKVVLPNPPEAWLYSFCDGEISSRRFILAQALPILLLTLFPILLCIFFQVSSPWLNVLIFINGMYSYTDMVNLFLFRKIIREPFQVRVNGLDLWYNWQEEAFYGDQKIAEAKDKVLQVKPGVEEVKEGAQK